jgi:hypothetical protein
MLQHIRHDLISATKFIALALVIGCLLAFIQTTCELPTAQADEAPTSAIGFLLERDNAPKNDPRWALADDYETMLVEVAESEGIDPALFIAMAFLESSFDPKAVGNIGEKGLVQVHGKAARGCDLTTPRGQAVCGAQWLVTVSGECGGAVALDREKCLKTGSLGACSGGLSAYASGRCAASDRVAGVVLRRFKLAEKIRPYLKGSEATLASGGF